MTVQTKQFEQNNRQLAPWNWRKSATALLLLGIIVCVVAFVSWATTPLAPTRAALSALQSDANVTVNVENDLIEFSPVGETASSGLIFYPGGDVDFRAYAAPARAIADAGYLVIVPRVLFNHAVFSPNVAEDIIDAYPKISHWVVGGHSLGGSMAARFGINQQNVVDGVVFWGSYPGGDVDWTTASPEFALIYGTRDGLVSPDELEIARTQLPADSAFIPIGGGNHAQFGDYGAQEGDLTATISPFEQQEAAVVATVRFMERISAD